MFVVMQVKQTMMRLAVDVTAYDTVHQPRRN